MGLLCKAVKGYIVNGAGALVPVLFPKTDQKAFPEQSSKNLWFLCCFSLLSCPYFVKKTVIEVMYCDRHRLHFITRIVENDSINFYL